MSIVQDAQSITCSISTVSIEEFPGIQTLCMKLAYRMCSFYPELMDELKRTLEAMEIDYYKPAVKCLRKRILSGKFKYKILLLSDKNRN